jgi:hypothetical protein
VIPPQRKEVRFAGQRGLYLLDGTSRFTELRYREEMERFAADGPWFTDVSSVSRP